MTLGLFSDMTFVLTALWEIYKTRKHVAQTTSINIIVCAGYQHGFTYQDPPLHIQDSRLRTEHTVKTTIHLKYRSLSFALL